MRIPENSLGIVAKLVTTTNIVMKGIATYIQPTNKTNELVSEENSNKNADTIPNASDNTPENTIVSNKVLTSVIRTQSTNSEIKSDEQPLHNSSFLSAIKRSIDHK